MPDLPSGTVVFLFTDVEGSTRGWERDSAAMRAAIERYFALMGTAVEGNHGFLFKKVGDAIQASFFTAQEAVSAAHAAHRNIATEPWGDIGELQVRIALHAGDANPEQGDYLAPCLNRLARLIAAAHGGQVLLSAAVWQLLNGRLPVEANLQDLGEHRLRDLLEPERVFQLVVSGVTRVFQPLRTLDRHATNLPVQPTPLLGRDADINAVSRLIQSPNINLLTLTGVGGTGKTRLALQVGAELLDDFDGVYLVELAPLTEPELVASTIAQTLGVRESRGQPILEALQEYLNKHRLLLILDSFEHLLPAAAQVATVLSHCRDVKILATSREPLHLRAEHQYHVLPLALPDLASLPSLTQLAQCSAVQLFVERSQAVRADFRLSDENALTVARICSRLDGLPLAIELAAARSRALPPDSLLERLDNRLALLTSGPLDLPARQRTLRATIAWSHNLLESEEQAIFRLLAAFPGGATFDAIEAIYPSASEQVLDVLDGITSLVDKNLVRQVDGVDGRVRYGMLETVREYAREQLKATGHEETTRQAHAAFFLGEAEEAAPKLIGPEQMRWLRRLEADHDNHRGALRWVLDQGEVETASRYAAALWRFWYAGSHLTEGRGWLDRVLSLDYGTATLSRARAFMGAGALACDQGDFGRARKYYEESLELARMLNDPFHVAASLNCLGDVAKTEGDYHRAKPLLEQALKLARELGDKRVIAGSLNDLGNVAKFQADYETAASLLEQSLGLRRELRDHLTIGWSLNDLGDVATDQGNFEHAANRYRQSLEHFREVNHLLGIALGLESAAILAARQHRLRRAAWLFGAAEALRDMIKHPLTPSDRTRYDPGVSIVLEHFSGAGIADFWAAGRLQSWRHAVSVAIGETDTGDLDET